jgi:hypothetical protein
MTRVAFSAREVGGAGPALVGIAGLLEEYAAECSPKPSARFTERVLSAIAREQPPTPPMLVLRSLRERSLAGVARYLAVSLQAAVGARRSFPLAVRAQAIAIVLVAVIVLGGGGVALAAGAAGLAHALAPVFAPRAAPALQHSRPVAPGHSHVRQAPHHKLKPHHVPPAKGKPDDHGRGATTHEASGGGPSSGNGTDERDKPEAKSPNGTDATHSSAKPTRASASGES